MHGHEVCATAGGVRQRHRDGHHALQRRVTGLELELLDDLLVGNELEEAVVDVAVGRGLAGGVRGFVTEGDADVAALAGLEGVHYARHTVGNAPALHRIPVHEGAVYGLTRRGEVARDAGRAHATTLARERRRAASSRARE